MSLGAVVPAARGVLGLIEQRMLDMIRRKAVSSLKALSRHAPCLDQVSIDVDHQGLLEGDGIDRRITAAGCQ